MKRLLPYALVAGLVLIYFAPLVLHPTDTLYAERSDLLAMHLPNKVYLVRSWQATGEIPLWNPHVFAGMPFAQDMQVAAFYPPYFPLYLMPEDWLGPAMSWLVVLHVIIAGWCAYAHARSYLGTHSPLAPLGRGVGGEGFSPEGRREKWWGIHLGAFVAALGYAFAGKWMLHLLAGGHFPMLGLAWAPLVLLFLERAIQQSSWRLATWAGGAFALIILGSHPQVMFYSGLFVALWAVGPALERAGWFGLGQPTWSSTGRALGVWLGVGTWTLAVAVALAAIQLLPNLAIIEHASRAQGLESHEGLWVALWKATELVGPPLGEPTWEERGGFTLLWLILAGLGLLVSPRRFRFLIWVWLMVVAFGLGGATWLDWAPGFAYFRLPGRILWFAAIPVALLTGSIVQIFANAPARIGARAGQCRVVLLGVVILSAALVGLWAMAMNQLGKSVQPHAIGYWIFALAAAGVGYFALHRTWASVPRWLVAGLVAVLLADLWALTWPFVATRQVASVYQPSACVQSVKEQLRDHGRVLDRDLANQPGATPLGFALPMLLGMEPVRGWHSLDVRQYKELVQFISDVDRPVPTRELIHNFPIRNKPILDLLGVQFVIEPRDDLYPPNVEMPLDQDPRWKKVGEDASPQAFGVTNSSGVRVFPPYVVYENLDVMPRAFVVGQARPLADDAEVLGQLRATDFRRVVLLEGLSQATTSGAPGQATIRSYRPNRIEIDVVASTPGWLVLADVWYPGWEASVDGQAVPALRANYAFRAVAVPQGEHHVTFTLNPPSYRCGKLLTVASALAFAILLVGQAWLHFRKRGHS